MMLAACQPTGGLAFLRTQYAPNLFSRIPDVLKIKSTQVTVKLPPLNTPYFRLRQAQTSKAEMASASTDGSGTGV